VQRISDDLVLSPTDLTKHLGCPHITTLDLLALDGAATAAAADDALELIFRLGLAHEDAYLQSLRERELSVVTIAPATRQVGRAQRETETVEAMRRGVDVVYQATFYDGAWGGQADFLLRVERPSLLGAWSYDIADTKLARKLKVPALLQMATYADRLAVLQGVAPDKLYVVTGDGHERAWRLVDVAAFARRARSRLREAVQRVPATAPVPVPRCGQCRWLARCDRQWRDEDDLSLVAFMRGDHREALREHGITTLAALGRLAAEDLPRQIGTASRERLVHQASLQLWEREHRQARYDLLEPVAGKGLLRLPLPDPGDVYLDFEGDPYAEGGEGREYLAGLGDIDRAFTPIWAHTREAERELTVELVDRLLERWKAHPGMHVYHYAPYETTALKRLVSGHGVREEELDQLLRAERFVDLYAVVRQGLRISKGSYSLKKMEAFYWGHIRNQNPDVADAMSSVIAYERWSAEPDDVTLAQILAYNRNDVLSTLDLHRWLEQRRAELESRHGRQPRPDEREVDPFAPPTALVLAELALAEDLQAAGQPTLAALVQWHRREAKPAWWDVYRLKDLDVESLIEDATAVGGLSAPRLVREVARSRVWRYEFPSQDCKLVVGKVAWCVETQAGAGTVEALHAEDGWLELKRGKTSEPLRPIGLGPAGPVSTTALAGAISEVGRRILAGADPLGRALLERRTPTGTRVRPGETPRRAVVRVGIALGGTVLAVQGPPGSGKTTVGAELIRALLDGGRTVGVTAVSHAVIGNLLTAVGRPALQRCTHEEHCAAAGVEVCKSNSDAAAALATGAANLVGGTAWAWSSEDLRDAVDVLVIEEAGQFSLANAVAVSLAARSLVLLGDPQQLAQPTRALHPGGAGVSALEHMLAGDATIAPDRGIFLGTSWRMHPAITAYVSELAYDGRLVSGPDQQRQAVDAGPGLAGSGLRVVDVAHLGNAAASRQEVAAVAALWHRLTAGTVTDRTRATRPMTAEDVLVVAPYNNQVGLLRQAIPLARVGTVDKFQGQEAPVVIYSMTSSSAQDAPRGIMFLYDTHRLNVAVSRAQALAIVVLSPLLLDAAVGSPEQLRQVNALCRLVEDAGVLPAAAP